MAPSDFHQTFTGRTCLKWSADGSLSEHDHQELMKRLCSVDPVLAETDVCDVQNDVALTGYESAQMKRFLRSQAEDPETQELA